MLRIVQTPVRTTESERMSREKDGIKASLLRTLSVLDVQEIGRTFLSDIRPIRSGSAGETSANRNPGFDRRIR